MTRPFVSLLHDHDHLTETFAQHQEALLLLDVARAKEQLACFERTLSPHMRIEEEWLIPCFEKHLGTKDPGTIELLRAEHGKMMRLLADLRAAVEDLLQQPSVLPRDIIALLDREANFKNLLLHHDLRERNVLYPALDRVTTEAEREEVWKAIEGCESETTRRQGDAATQPKNSWEC